MVDRLTDATVAGSLEELVGWASTRYSESPGCQEAAEAAYAAFSAAGLPVQLQDYSNRYAPNVIAELRGETAPDDVLIVLAHLDDMPEQPPAPGADDNASGSAMVLALARAMVPYRFASTVKFILVTGEEQGLVGSTFYAMEADRRGEQIRAVLNADMIGWQGDGQPDVEDIDINYDVASEWLATLMHQAASLYETGGPVNAFPCPSMVFSDHAPFWRLGLSAVCGITDNEDFCHQPGTYPYYHTHADTIANCGDLSFFAGASRTFLASLAQLAVPIGRRGETEGHRRPLGRP
jgi:Zn-dependent M28 family amino/carboxypeptidase